MKIYNEVVIDMNPESSSYKETLHEDSFEYSGPMALCWGWNDFWEDVGDLGDTIYDNVTDYIDVVGENFGLEELSGGFEKGWEDVGDFHEEVIGGFKWWESEDEKAGRRGKVTLKNPETGRMDKYWVDADGRYYEYDKNADNYNWTDAGIDQYYKENAEEVFENKEEADQRYGWLGGQAEFQEGERKGWDDKDPWEMGQEEVRTRWVTTDEEGNTVEVDQETEGAVEEAYVYHKGTAEMNELLTLAREGTEQEQFNAKRMLAKLVLKNANINIGEGDITSDTYYGMVDDVMVTLEQGIHNKAIGITEENQQELARALTKRNTSVNVIKGKIGEEAGAGPDGIVGTEDDTVATGKYGDIATRESNIESRKRDIVQSEQYQDIYEEKIDLKIGELGAERGSFLEGLAATGQAVSPEAREFYQTRGGGAKKHQELGEIETLISGEKAKEERYKGDIGTYQSDILGYETAIEEYGYYDPTTGEGYGDVLGEYTKFGETASDWLTGDEGGEFDKWWTGVMEETFE